MGGETEKHFKVGGAQWWTEKLLMVDGEGLLDGWRSTFRCLKKRRSTLRWKKMSKIVSSDNNYKHCMGRSMRQNTTPCSPNSYSPRCVLLSRTDNSNCILSSLSPWSDGMLQHTLTTALPEWSYPLEYGVIGDIPRHS